MYVTTLSYIISYRSYIEWWDEIERERESWPRPTKRNEEALSCYWKITLKLWSMMLLSCSIYTFTKSVVCVCIGIFGVVYKIAGSDHRQFRLFLKIFYSWIGEFEPRFVNNVFTSFFINQILGYWYRRCSLKIDSSLLNNKLFDAVTNNQLRETELICLTKARTL